METTHINFELPVKLRKQFKAICRERKVTVRDALCVLVHDFVVSQTPAKDMSQKGKLQ